MKSHPLVAPAVVLALAIVLAAGVAVMNAAASGQSATGGTVTEIPGYKVHTFTAGGPYTLTPSLDGTVSVLVVGGGGGGGYAASNTGAGGGGAGGFVYNPSVGVTGGTGYTVSVGASGTAGTSAAHAGNGGLSAFGAIQASGGGGGANSNTANGAGAVGGSGGGASGLATSVPGPGTAAQGNAGGVYGNSTQAGSGGGGANATGTAGSGSTGGGGGAGRQSDITGALVAYAGGGGGGGFNSLGAGGAGGGGTGGQGPNTAPLNGSSNTGGGGGGAGAKATATPGAAGGSGIAIVRYAIQTHQIIPTGTHGSITLTTSNVATYSAGVPTVNDGRDAAFTITPDSNYFISDVKVDGSSVGRVTTYSFSNVTADHTISATFAPLPGGTTRDGNYLVATFTSSGTFTPPSGVTTADVLVGGGGGGGGTNTGSNTGGGGGGGGQVQQVASVGLSSGTPYTVIVGAGGSTSGAPGVSSSFGDTTADGGSGGTASATTPFGVGGPSGSGNAGGAANTVNFGGGGGGQGGTGVAGGTTGGAGGAAVTSAVSGSTLYYGGGGGGGANGGGKVGGAGSGTNCGGAGGSNGAAAAGVPGSGGGGGGGAAKSAFGAGGSGIVIVRYPIPTYAITATAGSGGSISPIGVTTVSYGGSQTYTIAPGAHYHIVNVIVDGASKGTTTSVTFTNVANNHTISASFAIDTYTLTYTAGAGGTVNGVASLMQTVGWGLDGSPVLASPNGGYHFARWSDGSTDNPRIDMNVTANNSYTAYSSEDVTVTATASSRPYNGTTVTSVDVTCTALDPADGVTITYTVPATFADKNAGTGKTVTVSGIALNGVNAWKYHLASSTATTTAGITPAVLAISAQTDSKTYDGGVCSPVEPTVSGLQGFDTVIGLVQTFDSKDVGAKTLSVSDYAVNDGNSGNNYTVTTHIAPGSIIARGLTVDFTAADKPYDGTRTATIAGRTLSGVLGSEDVTVTGGTATFDTKYTGTSKTVTATGFTLFGAEAANYSIGTTRTTTASITFGAALSTTATFLPASPEGLDHWYTTTPTVSFSASPIEPFWAHYWFDGSTPQTYTAPFEVQNGTHTLSFFSADQAGQRAVEDTQTTTLPINVDTWPDVRGGATSPGGPVEAATTIVTDTSVLISWPPLSEQPPSGIDHYEVWDAYVGSTYSTSYLVTGLTPQTPYSFRVFAVSGAGTYFSSSATLTVTTQGPPDIVAAQAPDGHRVFVDWQPVSTYVGDVGYHVWRSADGVAYSQIATLTGQYSASYTDTGLRSSTRYWYAVSTFDDTGESSLSDTSTAAWPYIAPVTGRPQRPEGLGAIEGSGTIALHWQPSSDASITYDVLRAGSSLGVEATLTTGLRDAVYTDDTVQNGEPYYYQVVAVDGSGTVGLPSLELEATGRVAVTDPDPHVYGDGADSAACICHAAHTPMGTPLLRSASPTDTVCAGCHTPTTAQAEFADPLAKSSHPLGADNSKGGRFECVACHRPVHTADEPLGSLLLVNGTWVCVSATDTPPGTGFCYRCHGSGSTLPQGDLSVFENSAHSQVTTSTGSSVKCEACHENHTSRNEALLKYSGVMVCVQCHGQSANPAVPDIWTRLQLSQDPNAQHSILPSAQGTGGHMGCQNCHNSHASTETTPLVDPHNPGPTGAWKRTVNEFCFACHDGDELPTAAQTTPWAGAVVGSGNATHTTDIKDVWSTSVHGSGAHADAAHLRSDMGYQAGGTLDCAACHDPHGTSNAFHLKESVSSATGSKTVDGLLVYKIPDSAGGGYDLRFFCEGCHVFDPTTHQSLSGTDTVQFGSVDCTKCHRHITSGGQSSNL
ncbi:MAG TPA: YDG domain-containing protein [Coriobacteriia bacterium]